MKILGLIFFASLVWGCANLGEDTNSPPMKCNDGQTQAGFLQPSTTGMFECQQGTQVCVNGEWTGPELYNTCENFTKPCGSTPHGSVENGYLTPIAPCTQSTRVCLNGQWQGPPLYSTCQ